MFAFKKKYYLLIESIKDINIRKIKKYNKFDSKNVKISDKNSLEKNNVSIQFWKDIINNLRRRNIED